MCVVTGRFPASAKPDNTWFNAGLCRVCILIEQVENQAFHILRFRLQSYVYFLVVVPVNLAKTTSGFTLMRV